MLFLCRPIVHNFFFLICKLRKRDVRPYAHGPADVGHQRPHERIPGSNGPLVNGQGFIRHKRSEVYFLHHPCPPAGPAGALTVKGQFLSRRTIEMLPAYRADQFLLSSYRQGWRVVVAIGTAVAGKSGEHKPEAVQQFRTGAEGAADPGYPWPLSQGQGSRNVKNFIYLRFRGLGHPPPGVGGKGLQVTAGAFCIEDAQSQGRFPGTGNPGDSYNLIQGDIYIYIFQIVDFGATDLNNFWNMDILEIFLSAVHKILLSVKTGFCKVNKKLKSV